MASRLDEFAPVETFSDEERRTCIRALMATDLDQVAEDALRRLEQTRRAIEGLDAVIQLFVRI